MNYSDERMQQLLNNIGMISIETQRKRDLFFEKIERNLTVQTSNGGVNLFFNEDRVEDNVLVPTY